MDIDTGSHPPIKRRPYKVPAKEREVLGQAVKDQLKGGVIQKSASSWACSAFVAWRKMYGSNEEPKPRKVIDYRPLNKITRPDLHPAPDITTTCEEAA